MSSVPSPCNAICILDKDICTGCGRSTSEIAAWPFLSEVERRKIVERLCPSLLEEHS
ncbi:MAG: DUF1289 domain-containing protein [Candidatus Diapherotrites archaeon]|uniref:DUF1289 domain-containing protein n=1 Tax=Candidatus Iainarchaeum sp. TaxID=3101447 RepID=A0A8T4C6M9_9ARCH|nr:DUF1289 domain-containing protein [Candidatus Diapherotrites archaeon]